MSGKNVGVVGSRRGYLLTDEIAVRHVASLLDAAPPHSGCGANERTIAAANRYPYTLRANAAGMPCRLVLTLINGVPQAVLVDRMHGREKRRMTCVPVRFDECLHGPGVVASAVLTRDPDPVLVLEDVLYMAGGRTENATAAERAEVLYDLVHERHRADPVLQPFKVQCARHLAPDIVEARQTWKAYGHPVTSFTLCPMNPGQRDVWIRSVVERRSGGPALDRSPPAPGGAGSVLVKASDLPDVFMVVGSDGAVLPGAGPVIIRTLDDSEAVRKLSKSSAGQAFRIPASWDRNSRRWTYCRV
jgi:hypothetical protein